MDKTFAETKGKAPFDWNQFLANPPIRYSGEHVKAVELAADWVTCAVGNQCAIIPRTASAPRDGLLTSLGAIFSGDVAVGEWGNAQDTLAAIEARSAVLIQQELAKLNP